MLSCSSRHRHGMLRSCRTFRAHEFRAYNAIEICNDARFLSWGPSVLDHLVCSGLYYFIRFPAQMHDQKGMKG